MSKEYSVYIMSSRSGTLYIGVTSDLYGRVWEHKNNIFKRSFTARYSCYKLVHYEDYNDIRDAIQREKELKGWKRIRKQALIKEKNALWLDLAKEWY